MYRLIYVSSAVGLLSEESLLQLLKKACEKNEKLGITGMLLYKGGNFMQLLEGERTDVLDIYARICTDERHRDCITILSEETAHRCFENWSMGFCNMDMREELPDFEFIEDLLTLRSLSDKPDVAAKLLLQFSETN